MAITQFEIYRVATVDTISDAVDPMFAIRDDADQLYLVGERHLAQELHNLLRAFLSGEIQPEIISEDDPRFGGHISIAEAVEEAIAAGYYERGDEDRARNSINVAAAAGRIRGAAQGTTGRWTFPPRTFRGWLVRSQADPRGRPRKTA